MGGSSHRRGPVDDRYRHIGEAVAALVAAVSCGLAAYRTANPDPACLDVLWRISPQTVDKANVWAVYEVGMGVSVPLPIFWGMGTSALLRARFNVSIYAPVPICRDRILRRALTAPPQH